jgi:hypothetical protein
LDPILQAWDGHPGSQVLYNIGSNSQVGLVVALVVGLVVAVVELI